ncbi:MAG TPA: DUF2163 domain-containing protein [bacterium]|nr:DUF2163 domain-containing protein [bacterium]
MTRACPVALLAHIKSGSTQLCRLFEIRTVAGIEHYFTDSQQDVKIGDITYKAKPGIEISAIRENADEGFADATVTPILDDDNIREKDVRNRLLKDATVKISIACWSNPEYGTMFVYGGKLGDNIITGLRAEITVIGSSDAGADLTLGEVFSERCRNIFGDRRCGVDLDKLKVPFQVIGLVEGTKNKFYVSVELPQPDNTNDELDNITEELITMGSGDYVVPECRALAVTVRGSGGGAGLLAAPGSPTSFGPLLATGGSGNASPSLAVQTHARDGIGSGGSTNLRGKGEAGGSWFLLTGGDGGYTSKVFVIGEDLQIGDSIPYSIGLGGIADNNEDHGQSIGRSGTIKIITRDQLTTIDNGYNFGSILWSEGENKGVIHSIISYANDGLITVSTMLNDPIKIGDKGFFRPGCSRYRSNCISYDNIINYRGEPDVPNIVPVTIGANAVPDKIETKSDFLRMG